MIVNLISFLSGFLFSSILDTTLGEFQEWAIVGAALIVATLETLSKNTYPISTYFKSKSRKLNKKYVRQFYHNFWFGNFPQLLI